MGECVTPRSASKGAVVRYVHAQRPSQKGGSRLRPGGASGRGLKMSSGALQYKPPNDANDSEDAVLAQRADHKLQCSNDQVRRVVEGKAAGIVFDGAGYASWVAFAEHLWDHVTADADLLDNPVGMTYFKAEAWSRWSETAFGLVDAEGGPIALPLLLILLILLACFADYAVRRHRDDLGSDKG